MAIQKQARLHYALVVLILSQIARGSNALEPSCPKTACDVFNTRRFRKALWTSTSSLKLEKKWSVEKGTFAQNPESNVCVDSGANLTCRFATGLKVFNSTGGLVGQSNWENMNGSTSIPVVDVAGQVVSWTTQHVFSLSSGVQLRWIRPVEPPIRNPGGMISPTATNNSIIMFAIRNASDSGSAGIIFGYDPVGAPLARVYLTGEVGGVSGVFQPLTSPAVVGARLFYVAEFVKHNNPETSFLRPLPHAQVNDTCAIVAVDQTNEIDGRLVQAWTIEFVCSRMAIPVGPIVFGSLEQPFDDPILIFSTHEYSKGQVTLYAAKNLMGKQKGNITWKTVIRIPGESIHLALTDFGNRDHRLILSSINCSEIIELNPVTGEYVQSYFLAQNGIPIALTGPVTTGRSSDDESVNYLIAPSVYRPSGDEELQAGLAVSRLNSKNKNVSSAFTPFPASGLADKYSRQISYLGTINGDVLVVVPLTQSGLVAYYPESSHK